jgi:PAS domain S-box-containing protein
VYITGGDGAVTNLVADKRAIIIMNAQSVIQIASDSTYNVLGYTKHELKGKNIRIILPPTIADVHATYVRNYITTGM